MRSRTIRLLLIVSLMLTVFMTAASTSAQSSDTGIDTAIKWLGTLQNADGGFSDGSKPDSSISATADAIFSITNAGQDVTTFTKGGKSPLDYLEGQLKAGKVTTLHDYAKVLRAATAAGVLTPNGDANGAKTGQWGGVDLVQTTLDLLSRSLDGKDLYSESIAMLALSEIGFEIPPVATAHLIKSQNKDGGWSTAIGQPSDPITTSVALQALIAIGKYRLVGSALAYYKAAQDPDGGWSSPKSADSDCTATSAALQALWASGEDMSDWNNPNSILAKFQQKDGSFSAQLKQPAGNFQATVDAISALSADYLLSYPQATKQP